jgi:tripartite ATP-independent transporter DctM subunit
MSPDLLAPLMCLTLLALVFSGYPVAFSVGGTALLFAGIGILTDQFPAAFLMAFPERVFGIMSNYLLLAVPFFIFMGTMLEKSRLAEDLLRTVGTLFGPVRGGLAFAVVLVGALLAAATGIIGASVVTMGLISLPVMRQYGYSDALATGVIAASGTLGQIIPPSIVLIVLADQIGIPVGDLFAGAVIPGVLLAGAYAVWVAILALARPSVAPALPRAERTVGIRPLLGQVAVALLPAVALILLVLGSIFAGIATPTEAGALGALGAVGLAAARRRLSTSALKETTDQTTRLTSMVMFLLVGSTAFALVFRGLGGDLWIVDLLTDLPGGDVGLLIAVHLTIFFLGFFIDFFEIVFIILPLFVPAARALGIDMVWFGVLIAVNLQTSFLTPPFGFALFYLRGVAPPEIETSTIYRGAIPFVMIQLVVLVLLACFPQLVLTP